MSKDCFRQHTWPSSPEAVPMQQYTLATLMSEAHPVCRSPEEYHPGTKDGNGKFLIFLFDDFPIQTSKLYI